MELIDKDAVVVEIEKVLNSYHPTEITSGRYALKNLLSFIDTLEVKEVDLDVDLDEEVRYMYKCDNSTLKTEKQYAKVAKHFFELGLKAQKE